MKLLTLIAVLLSGCGVKYYPSQDEATRLVWFDSYGERSAPPIVYWSEETCPGTDGSKTAVVAYGKCYSGLTFDAWNVAVAWRGSFWQSAFAHELMHASQLRRGIQDPNHERKEDWLLEVSANNRLMMQEL